MCVDLIDVCTLAAAFFALANGCFNSLAIAPSPMCISPAPPKTTHAIRLCHTLMPHAALLQMITAVRPAAIPCSFITRAAGGSVLFKALAPLHVVMMNKIKVFPNKRHQRCEMMRLIVSCPKFSPPTAAQPGVQNYSSPLATFHAL